MPCDIICLIGGNNVTYTRKSNGSDNAVAARKKWDAENLERLSIAMPKGKKARIKDHAAARGESVNGFVNRVIDEALDT